MKNEAGSNSPFLDDLRHILNESPQENVEYLYDFSDEGNRRWANLVSYLGHMKVEQPDILMIGEAPGYRGTSVSGVPFLSEQMIKMRRNDNLKLPIDDYTQSSSEASGYEATSTVVWKTFDRHPECKLPLLWATLPNHPHNPGDNLSNRRPNAGEIRPYLKAIDMLIAEYAIRRVVAIGNVAYETLIKYGYNDITKIRHPARGGARDFSDGYKRLIEDRDGEH